LSTRIPSCYRPSEKIRQLQFAESGLRAFRSEMGLPYMIMGD